MKASPGRKWRKFIWRRKEVLRTTWRFRLVAGAAVLLLLLAAHRPILTAVGRSLIHSDPAVASDAIVLEHYDPDYLIFERAREVRESGLAQRVLVPCQTFGGPTNLNAVSAGIIDVMTRVSRLEDTERIPLNSQEPYTLNTARAVADYLVAQDINSVIVVSPSFRSNRSFLVYKSVLDPLDIAVTCVPSRGTVGPDNWWKTTHGVQCVGLEFGKLWYYRLFVL